ncbi:efflux RND transporter periplasmic adaptor subunit [Ohtaekwangia koreensis]|nr:efflux RND transporter periplasmic adaptor subunit [Ohtaekwangia koreensis]
MKKSLKNKMKPYTSTIAWVLFSILLLTVSACSTKEAAHHDTYTCPMHPTVVSDKPGTCPVCGMDLVRKAREGEEVKMTEDLAKGIKSPNESILASVKIIKGEHKKVSVSLPVQGIVTYDTRYTYSIPVRISGRLEKVYIKYAYQPVHKGQKIAEIYSPDMLMAQREFLYILQQERDTALIESAKRKLHLLGASAKQVDQLIKRKEPLQTFTVFSAYDGYIINETNAAPTLSNISSSTSTSVDAGMNGGMGSTSASAGNTTSPSNATSSSLIREGSYVSTGQTLFKVINPSAFRIELNLSLLDADIVKAGDALELDLGNGNKQKATIDFVQPFFNQEEAFVKVRVYMKNTKEFQIGQLINATILIPEVEAFWLPKQAVLDLGLEKIVFIKERGAFKPKKIRTGIYSGDLVAVQGIASSDEIASNAQYLVDSESFIKPKN